MALRKPSGKISNRRARWNEFSHIQLVQLRPYTVRFIRLSTVIWDQSLCSSINDTQCVRVEIGTEGGLVQLASLAVLLIHDIFAGPAEARWLTVLQKSLEGRPLIIGTRQRDLMGGACIGI